MKRFLSAAFLFTLLFSSCSKNDVATKSDHYRDVVFKIEFQDSALLVNFPRAVYDNNQKGNIKKDSVLAIPGTYLIPATVLAGEITLYGESSKSGNFNLQIIGPGNVVAAKTDTITFDTANVLHSSRWYARIKANL